MVKIYTRKGDDGTTSLWYGGRVPKHHARTEAYGSLDEACAALGVARALCGEADEEELAADILRLQDDIFVAGAELATAPDAAGRLEDGISRTTEEMVATIEGRIDHYMGQVELPPKFVIPGGNQLSAQLDVARTAIRRAERRIAALADAGELPGETVIHLVNRASDLAFAMARYADVAEPELFKGRGKQSAAP
ncbi:MAG: cob(I)yrinic acid a,c-diamide adenosyltransferase [Solirubrobacterales bacterium]